MRDMDAVVVAARRCRPTIRTGLPLNRVPLGRRWVTAPGPCSTRGGQLLAVYEATTSDRIRPTVVLAGPGETVVLAGPVDADHAADSAGDLAADQVDQADHADQADSADQPGRSEPAGPAGE